MMNARLSAQEMKEMISLFVQNKLNSLKIGDFEIQKSHYEQESINSDNKTSIQDDPLFYSAAHLPPEVQDMLSSMMKK